MVSDEGVEEGEEKAGGEGGRVGTLRNTAAHTYRTSFPPLRAPDSLKHLSPALCALGYGARLALLRGMRILLD